MKRLAVALIITLSACVSPQQQRVEQQQRIRADFQQRMAAWTAEVRTTMADDRRFDPIRDKIPLADSRDATLPMMALTSKPAEDEKVAIEAWQQAVRDLRQKSIAILQQFAPSYVPIFEMSAAAGFSLVADLYAGKLSYGDYNRQRLGITNRAIQAVHARDNELRHEQIATAQAQAQIAAQQSLAASTALAGFQNFLLGQQLINQQFQPTRIAPFTCSRYGNISNCF